MLLAHLRVVYIFHSLFVLREYVPMLVSSTLETILTKLLIQVINIMYFVKLFSKFYPQLIVKTMFSIQIEEQYIRLKQMKRDS